MKKALKKFSAAFGRESQAESDQRTEDACEAKDEYMIRNGALLLHKQISYGHGKGSATGPVRTFTAREIRKATNNYEPSLILGQKIATGYRGILEDGRVVAVKSPRGLSPTEETIDFFLNQVVIKEIVNHKNVAKLHGCCLETRVPTLVYEFYPNGTLSDQIHGRDGANSILAFNVPWSKLVRIASETSHVLSYMHALTKPIIHMDVKPSNIYLDESFVSKLTSFGFSVPICPGEDFISPFPVGTVAYADPDYQDTYRVMEKCDVYSLGVTLMELLTGLDPVKMMEQECELVNYFVWHLERERLLEIVHRRVLREAATEEIRAFAEVAVRCTARRGEQGPTMREVAIELRQIHLAAKQREW